MSLPRLYFLRLGYLVIAVGLALTKWPLIINHDRPWPLFEGVETCMLVALSLLWFLGLRYPLQMLPVLLFEIAWKFIWMIAVVLPLWISDQLDPATLKVFYACLVVVIPLAVIPWRYVFANYVRKPGDRWRSDRHPRSSVTPKEQNIEHIMSGPMAGRTVLITGATSGIGRATAVGLARMGAHLAITGRDRVRTEDAVREIRAAGGGQVDLFIADLSSQSEVRRLAEEVLHSLSRIDVLINNVGGYWDTRHVTVRRTRTHLRPQPSRAVSAHQLAAGQAQAERAGQGGYGLLQRACLRAHRLQRLPRRAVLLRSTGVQPIQARQRHVQLRTG